MSRSRWLLLKSTFIASTQRVSQQHSSLQSACMIAMSASHRSEDNPIRGAILRKPGPLRDNPFIIEDVPTHPQRTKPPQGPHLRRLPHRPAHRHRRAPTKATSLDPRPSDRRRGPRITLRRVSRRKPRRRLLGWRNRRHLQLLRLRAAKTSATTPPSPATPTTEASPNSPPSHRL